MAKYANMNDFIRQPRRPIPQATIGVKPPPAPAAPVEAAPAEAPTIPPGNGGSGTGAPPTAPAPTMNDVIRQAFRTNYRGSF